MEIEAKHINLVTFLNKFKPQADNSSNSKIILPNSDFMLIAAILKIASYAGFNKNGS